MTSRKIQYNAGELLPELEARTAPDASIMATARTMAMRYAHMCEARRPYFEAEEWELLRHAVGMRKARLGDDLRTLVRRKVTGGDYVTRFAIKAPAVFLERLESLDASEVIAARDWCEQLNAREAAEG